MPRYRVIAKSVALLAGTAKTVLRVKAPANHTVRLRRWGYSFNGTSGTAEPVLCRLLRQTTDGTMTAVTPEKMDDNMGMAAQSTCGKDASAEPTEGNELEVAYTHPQSGYVSPDYGDAITLGSGARLALKFTSQAAVSVNAWMEIEE